MSTSSLSASPQTIAQVELVDDQLEQGLFEINICRDEQLPRTAALVCYASAGNLQLQAEELEGCFSDSGSWLAVPSLGFPRVPAHLNKDAGPFAKLDLNQPTVPTL